MYLLYIYTLMGVAHVFRRKLSLTLTYYFPGLKFEIPLFGFCLDNRVERLAPINSGHIWVLNLTGN